MIETSLDPLVAAAYVALGAVVCVATFRRPADAVVALIVTSPFDFSHAVGATTLTFGKAALIGAIIGIALRRPSLAPLAAFPARTVAFSIVAVVAATALSVAAAHDRGAALRETLKAIEYALTFAVAAIAWSLDPDRGRLRFALLATVAAVAVLALVQESGGAPSGIWYNGHAYPRIAGPLEGPNQLAGYLGIVIPFLAIFAIETPSLGSLGTCALASAALVLTLSRSGLAAGAVALAIVLIGSRRGLIPALAAFAAGAAAASGVLIAWHVGGVGTRFISFGEVEQSGGVGTRRILWRAAYQLWRSRPFTGIGAGNFELSLPAVAPAGIKTHANSWYLQSLVEGGIPLLAATLALVWTSTASLRRALRNDLCLAAVAASAGFALHGIVDLLVFFPKVAVTWFVVLAIASIEANRTA